MTRSVPDQEVLKHSLSTLRNISRYPHLADVLIDTGGSVETILREMLRLVHSQDKVTQFPIFMSFIDLFTFLFFVIRNKSDGYFIAADLLKKLCSTKKGVDAVLSVPGPLKRLFDLVNELDRKVAAAKRSGS